jgi:hypothetical protein
MTIGTNLLASITKLSYNLTQARPPPLPYNTIQHHLEIASFE